MYKILDKREVAPNMHELVIEAPMVVKKAQPGQFVIVMTDEQSERIPYTLTDWDLNQGTITLVVQEVGRSSRKLILMEAGEEIAHVIGPLGMPLQIEAYGTVVLAAGCYGIGAILSIARQMKQSGNRVVSIVEARSHYLQYYKEKLEQVSDELIQTTIDGSEGVKGHAVDVLEQKLSRGEKIDRVIVVGCLFMMMLTSKATQRFGVTTLAALNPIMLDGTGMCGVCRVSVGDKTKFACVDGPFFDAHQIDWDAVRDRQAAYGQEEVVSLEQTKPVR